MTVTQKRIRREPLSCLKKNIKQRQIHYKCNKMEGELRETSCVSDPYLQGCLVVVYGNILFERCGVGGRGGVWGWAVLEGCGVEILEGCRDGNIEGVWDGNIGGVWGGQYWMAEEKR